MRAIAVIPPLCLALLTQITPVRAQVSVDMRALERLGPMQPPAPPVLTAPKPAPSPQATAAPPPATPPPAARAAAKPPVKTGQTASAPAAMPAASIPAATPPPATPPAASLPNGAPPPAPPTVLAPTPGKPARAPSAVSPTVSRAPAAVLPTVRPEAPPASTTIAAPAPPPGPPPAPVRLLFSQGATELSPDDQTAIRTLAHAIPAPETSSINVMAYAAGPENDPSTARRLSLSRGMAVRTALIASGFPAPQIYVRALGAPPPETAHTGAPADRVELVVGRLGVSAR